MFWKKKSKPASAGRFEKVSFKQFHKDFSSLYASEADTPESSMRMIAQIYDGIKLPQRATTGSAGYDFFAPMPLYLARGKSLKFPTGIRVRIEDGWWLGIVPRSSLGFKYRIQLDNTIGVIDSDYYYSDNEGHIWAKLTNNGQQEDPVVVEAGQAFSQGIFLPYGLTDNDNTQTRRNGGIGSTDKKRIK